MGFPEWYCNVNSRGKVSTLTAQLTIYTRYLDALIDSQMGAGAIMDGRISDLQALPTELLHLILASLDSWEIKAFSLVNRRLRDVCLPSLFHRVRFNFSEAGLEGLEQLKNSAVRLFVKSLNYTVPELIKPGKWLQLDVKSFEIFKSEMLTPESYVEEAKELYDCGRPADECSPYMVIYETL
jgi:hypothetical protein